MQIFFQNSNQIFNILYHDSHLELEAIAKKAYYLKKIFVENEYSISPSQRHKKATPFQLSINIYSNQLSCSSQS